MHIPPNLRFTQLMRKRKMLSVCIESMQRFHPNCKESKMRIELKTGDLRLTDGQTMRVVDAAGSMLCCSEGTVWVTEENQLRDVVLEAGGCVQLKRAGLTLVQALTPASLSIA